MNLLKFFFHHLQFAGPSCALLLSDVQQHLSERAESDLRNRVVFVPKDPSTPCFSEVKVRGSHILYMSYSCSLTHQWWIYIYLHLNVCDKLKDPSKAKTLIKTKPFASAGKHVFCTSVAFQPKKYVIRKQNQHGIHCTQRDQTLVHRPWQEVEHHEWKGNKVFPMFRKLHSWSVEHLGVDGDPDWSHIMYLLRDTHYCSSDIHQTRYILCKTWETESTVVYSQFEVSWVHIDETQIFTCFCLFWMQNFNLWWSTTQLC